MCPVWATRWSSWGQGRNGEVVQRARAERGARMVSPYAARYHWSSYQAHASGAEGPLTSEHPLCRRLGRG